MGGPAAADKGRRVVKKKAYFKKEQAACIAASLVLFGIAQWMNGEQSVADGAVKRGNPGSDEVQYEFLVKGLAEEEVPIEVSVNSRRPGKAEARENRRQVMEQLPDLILQENLSLQEVRSDLNLITRIEESGMELQWESDNPEKIDSFGRVYNQNIEENGETVCLTVTISDETGESTFQLPVRLLPPAYTQEQQKILELSQQISDAEEDSREEDYLILPKKFNGADLSYRIRPDRSTWLILIMGVAAAILYGLEEPVRQNEREKKRKELLMLEYSELVSKLQIYLGAGMTVRTAWERMAKDYQEQLSRTDRKEKKPVYEEVLRTCTDFNRGISESEAFRQFGRRCGLRPYLKLSSLLEQNRKTGLKNLRQMLDDDVADAFEERKNLAKKQGEKAGTKLLLPMFMLLAIVMVIVVVPAFMSLY